VHPVKVDRHRLVKLTDLPNIGPAGAADLRLLGYHTPQDLQAACPYQMYQRLCQLSGCLHDPCVLDVFISVTRFLAGEAARPWWAYTEQRRAQVLQGVGLR